MNVLLAQSGIVRAPDQLKKFNNAWNLSLNNIVPELLGEVRKSIRIADFHRIRLARMGKKKGRTIGEIVLINSFETFNKNNSYTKR